MPWPRLTAWADDKDTSETNHLAYIARQRAEIATNTARAPARCQYQAGLASEVDRIRLQARTQEADAARPRAQGAQQQAMSAEQRRTTAGKSRRRHGPGQRRGWDRARTEAQLRDMEAQQTERGLLVTLGDVLFVFNKADLSAQAGPRLDKLANFLKQFPDRKLLIEGYTDSVGGDSYNQDLSDRRAQAVRDALVQRGVDSSPASPHAAMARPPVADKRSPEGRAMKPPRGDRDCR